MGLFLFVCLFFSHTVGEGYFFSKNFHLLEVNWCIPKGWHVGSYLEKNERKGGWRWIAERPVASDKVPEGGHLSIFSPFLSFLFCFKDHRPSCGMSG